MSVNRAHEKLQQGVRSLGCMTALNLTISHSELVVPEISLFKVY